MSPSCLRLDTHGPVTVLTLDRPPANALDHDVMQALCDLLPRLRSCAALVLTGSGRFFSAGLDLLEVVGYEGAQAEAFAAAFDDAIAGLFALPVPVVAAVNGHAVAGGAVLAACADFRLLADGEARAGLTEILVGVPFPTSALEAVRFSCAGAYLPELLLRGQTYSGAAAIERRLADRLLPAAEVLPQALALATELGARPGPAYAASKRALRAEAVSRMEAARAGGSDPVWTTWRTPETRARMQEYMAQVKARARRG